MKTLFWICTVAALGMVISGALRRSPLIPDVSMTSLDEWYFGMGVFCFGLGIAVGSAVGLSVRRTTRYKPASRLSLLSTRVASWGVVSFAFGYTASVLLGIMLVARSVQFPLATGERIADLVLTSVKFHLWCAGLGAGAAALAYFAFVTFGPAWGGSYALAKMPINRSRSV
jgi:hypothetical protein